MLKMRSVSSLCLLVASTVWMACSPESGVGVIRLDGGSGGTGAPTAGTSGGAGTDGQPAGTSGTDPGTAGTTGVGTAGTMGTAGTGAGGDSTGTAGTGAAAIRRARLARARAAIRRARPARRARAAALPVLRVRPVRAAAGVVRRVPPAGVVRRVPPAGVARRARRAPAGAENKIVLYDGTAATFNSWASVRNPTGPNPWRNNADGTMTVVTGSGDIQSKMKFQDLLVHVEYMTPVIQPSDTGATGQNRGNSGVYLKGSYEMQILDSYGMAPAIDGCGAIYGIKAPSETACFMGGQWNTYEIEFKANVCNASGQKTANARIVKATLNGKVVQQDFEVTRVTTAGQAESCTAAGLLLQDHSSFKPVIYRNIWVIPRS